VVERGPYSAACDAACPAVPTFALWFVWHLILFTRYYESLAIYRKDVIIPFAFSPC